MRRTLARPLRCGASITRQRASLIAILMIIQLVTGCSLSYKGDALAAPDRYYMHRVERGASTLEVPYPELWGEPSTSVSRSDGVLVTWIGPTEPRRGYSPSLVVTIDDQSKVASCSEAFRDTLVYSSLAVIREIRIDGRPASATSEVGPAVSEGGNTKEGAMNIACVQWTEAKAIVIVETRSFDTQEAMMDTVFTRVVSELRLR
jgi:hypothetical protein